MGTGDSALGQLVCDAYLHRTTLTNYLAPREIANLGRFVTVRSRDVPNMMLHNVQLNSTRVLRRPESESREYTGNRDAWSAVQILAGENNYVTFAKRSGDDGEFDYIFSGFATTPTEPSVYTGRDPLHTKTAFEGAQWPEPDLKAIAMAAGSDRFVIGDESDEWSD